MEKMRGKDGSRSAEIRHLPRRNTLSDAEFLKQEVELSIAAHFTEQNELLRKQNKELMDSVQRLSSGVEKLVHEMNGVRTGKKAEAFARIAGIDAQPDLPTIGGEAAFYYIFTAKQIGDELGFHCSQIGSLLGAKGLQWAGNGEYQEIGRIVSTSQSKFWHREVPNRLKKILDENEPESFGIKDKSILRIFRRWQERKEQAKLLEQLKCSEQPH